MNNNMILKTKSIDSLKLSTKTKNNLKYCGFHTIDDLKTVDMDNHPKFNMFGYDLRKKIKQSLEKE